MFKNNLLRENQTKESGFTLIEVVVALSLFVMISLFIGVLAYYQFTIFNRETAELIIAHDSRVAIDTIDNYVRQATNVLASYDGFSTNSQTLVLKLQSINASNQLIAGTYDMVVFSVFGTDLLLEVFPNSSSSRPASTRKLTSSLDAENFSFSYDNASYDLVKQVTSNLALLQNQGGQIKSISISSKAKLRNYDE